MTVLGSALYLSVTVRAPVGEGRSLAFPCAEQEPLLGLSLQSGCSPRSHAGAAVPSRASPFPQLRLEGGISGEKGVAVCTHRAPAGAPTASSKVPPRVWPLLPTAVTSDPYYFCKVEQGRKNGCAASFFMRQDLLRTIGEINPSM